MGGERGGTPTLVAILSVAVLVLPAPAASQGRIRGAVTGTDGAPVPFALVQVRDGAQVSADERGRFMLDSMTVGLAWVAAVGPGCTVAMDSVFVRADREAVVRLRVADLGSTGPRAESTVGMSSDQLRARNFRSVYEALRAIAPYMVSHLTGEVGGDRYVSNRAGRTFAGNEPIVILDGIRLTQVTIAALEDIPIQDLERIEVARSAAAAWRYGIGNAGGVIVLTTKRSGRLQSAEDLASCSVSFPPR